MKVNLFRRYIALPTDHGSWVFLLCPLLIGLFAGGSWSPASFYLVIASLAAFLIRQPVTLIVKILSGRRNRRDLPAAWIWFGIYGLFGLLGLYGLVIHGFGFLFVLALPGIPVFMWHLYLVSRRAERRQIGVEIVASGVLALTAPAGLWVGEGAPDPRGWWLFVLVWLQSAASIVYAYLRLEQRQWNAIPGLAVRLRSGYRALLYTTFNLVGVTLLAVFGRLPPWLPLPFALQWLDTIWGTLTPAVGVKPTRIGLRQTIVSTLFTVLFILTWQLV
jgi:hypothetical protein